MKRHLLEEDLDTPEAAPLLADLAATYPGEDARAIALATIARVREACAAAGTPFRGILNPKYMRPGPQPANRDLRPDAAAAIESVIGHIRPGNNPQPERRKAGDGAHAPDPVRPVRRPVADGNDRRPDPGRAPERGGGPARRQPPQGGVGGEHDDVGGDVPGVPGPGSQFGNF